MRNLGSVQIHTQESYKFIHPSMYIPMCPACKTYT